MSCRAKHILRTSNFAHALDEAPSDLMDSDVSDFESDSDLDKDYIYSDSGSLSGEESEVPTPHHLNHAQAGRVFEPSAASQAKRPKFDRRAPWGK